MVTPYPTVTINVKDVDLVSGQCPVKNPHPKQDGSSRQNTQAKINKSGY